MTMTTKTYLGKTAGGILKNAVVAKSSAGLGEIFVTLPNGKKVLANLGDRSDFTGCAVRDVLVLTDIDGTVARLSTSSRAYNFLVALDKKAGAL